MYTADSNSANLRRENSTATGANPRPRAWPEKLEGLAECAVTLADLPPPSTRRWVASRKALVVAGVRAGIITLEEACARYSLSVEEFLSWKRKVETHGLPGLRTTRLQDYREQAPLPAE